MTDEKYKINLNKELFNDTPINIYEFYEKLLLKNDILFQEKHLDDASCALLTALTLLLNTYFEKEKRTYNHLYKLLSIMAEKADWGQKTLIDRLFTTSDKIDKSNVAFKLYQMFLFEAYNLQNYSLIISRLLTMYNKVFLIGNNTIKTIDSSILRNNLIEADKNLLNKISF